LPTTFTYHGENVENTRAKAINLDITDNKKLVLNVDAQNHSVTWTGSVDGTWNITENNWNGTNGVNTITQFLHNDDVIFSTTIQPIQKNISVNSSGVNVKTMTVNENGYKFSGGKIAGDSLALNSTSTNETIFQNEIDFTNGITVAQNNTLTFDYATDKTDSNKFSGLGTLKKSGSGTLTLTRDNSGATGMTFTQTDGIVNLQNIWGGSYMQSNSATLILSDNAKIGDDANLSGVVDITNGKLDVGGNLVLASGSVLKMTIAENKIVADSVTIDNDAKIELSQIPTGRTEKVIVAKTTPLNPSQLNSYFTLNSNKLLMSIQPFYSNDYKEMGFENSPQTAEQYTIKNNFRKNQVQIAALLDGYAPIQSQLHSLDTREQLEGLVKSLLAPELAAEAIALPLNNPYFRIFHHVNNLPINNNLRNVNSQSTNSGATFRGQSACSPIECNVERNKYELWFEGYYQGGETRGDANALSYKTSRGGMMVGADQYFDDGLLLGLIFGYGNPQVYNSVGKIEADDYTFGVYSRIKIFGIYTNTFVGYGNQNYQLRQNITNPNQHTNYNGDSFYASLELFQPINLRNDLSISPLFAIDFQKAWSDGFKTNAYIPLTVNKGDIDQTILRIGVNSNYKNLRTRLQYGYQIAGDFYGISRTSITGNNGNRILSGVNLGRHSLNAGLGGDFRIGNRTNLFADYDLDLGKLSTNHTGQFGFVRYF
jgi:outer membrane autotransporter protein